MKRFIAIVVLFSMSLVASYSFASDRFPELLEAWNRTESEYDNCLKLAAKLYARSDSTPSEIATAAQSKCDWEFIKNKATLTALNIVINMENRSKHGWSEKEAKRFAFDETEEYSQDLKNKMRGKIIQWVIEQRLQKAGPWERFQK